MRNQIQGKVFNYLWLRTFIGFIALFLPFIVWFVAKSIYPTITIPTSISITYYTGARDVFVGLLFIVSAFLFAYNGHYNKKYPESYKWQSIWSKVAGLCAAIVAIFPTKCTEWVIDVTSNDHACKINSILNLSPDTISLVHKAAAVILFVILAVFCLYYFQVTTKGEKGEKAIRSFIYRVCGWIMVLAMLSGAGFEAYQMFSKTTETKLSYLMFYVEMLCLVAFGCAWLVAGKQMPFLPATERERLGYD